MSLLGVPETPACCVNGARLPGVLDLEQGLPEEKDSGKQRMEGDFKWGNNEAREKGSGAPDLSLGYQTAGVGRHQPELHQLCRLV